MDIGRVPPVVAAPASLLAPTNGPKLTAEMVKDLRAKFLSHYPGELLSPDTTPSLHFLQRLRSALDKGLLWVPWRLRSSEADALRWQESRRPRADKQLLSLLLPDDDGWPFCEYFSVGASGAHTSPDVVYSCCCIGDVGRRSSVGGSPLQRALSVVCFGAAPGPQSSGANSPRNTVC